MSHCGDLLSLKCFTLRLDWRGAAFRRLERRIAGEANGTSVHPRLEDQLRMATAFRTERMIQPLSTRGTDDHHDVKIIHDSDLDLIDGRANRRTTSFCSYTYVDIAQKEKKLRASKSWSGV